MTAVAPFQRDSGKFSGKPCIQGGPANLPKWLCLAAHTTAGCHPVFAPFVRCLYDPGKTNKCSIVATLPKLLIHTQSPLKKAQLSLAKGIVDSR